MATAVAPVTAIDEGNDQQGRPFAGYASLSACLSANGDKEDPNAYCSAIRRTVEGRATMTDMAVLAREAQRSLVATPPVSPMTPSLPTGPVLRLEATEPAPLPLDTDQAKQRAPDTPSAAPMGLNATLTGQPDAQRTDGAMLSSGTADPQDSQAREDDSDPDDDCMPDENGEWPTGCLEVVEPPTGGDFIAEDDRSGSDSVKAGETGQDREDDDKAKDHRADHRYSDDQLRDDHGRFADASGAALVKGDTVEPHGPHGKGLKGGKIAGITKSKISGQPVAKIEHPDGGFTLASPHVLGHAFLKTGSAAPIKTAEGSGTLSKVTSIAEIAGAAAAVAALGHEMRPSANAESKPAPTVAPDTSDKKVAERTVDGSAASAGVLLPLQQMGIRPLTDMTPAAPVPEDARGLDGSTKQELMDDAKKRNRLIEQENIGVPVPGFGTGPLGPVSTPKLAIADQPTDKGGLIPPDNKTLDMGATPPIQSKGGPKKGQRSRVREDRFMVRSVRAISDEKLPTGICGRVQFVGLRYNEVDTYNTTFLPGCLNKSRNDKLSRGLIKLYRQVVSGEVHPHGVDTHIGVVLAMVDVGDDVICTADILDTEDGRKTKEYLTAAIPNGGTGASIGFAPRGSRPIMRDNKRVNAFTEVEIMEFTVTPINSVPGTDVLSVRASKDAEPEPAPANTAANGTAARGGEIASMESRIEAVRQSTRFILC